MSIDIKNFVSWIRGFLDDVYQVKLVSGQNIKTINNKSILESGNINTLDNVPIEVVSELPSPSQDCADKLYVLTSSWGSEGLFVCVYTYD